MLMGLASCATRTVPVGDWGRPADLNLHRESLTGLTLDVRCGHLDENDQLTLGWSPMCPWLGSHLKKYGAKMAGPQDKPDFTVWYLDRPKQPAETSALSMAAFYFTIGLIPYISTRRIDAEFRITDTRGAVVDRSPLQLESIRAIGWGAWVALFTGRSQRRTLGQTFLQFATNRVASQATRLHLAKAVEP